jgi:prefoldin subunit 5
MSEDPTQIDLRTILEAINAIGVELHQLRTQVERLEAKMNERFERIEVRLDKVEDSMTVLSGDVVQVRSAILRLRREEEQPA